MQAYEIGRKLLDELSIHLATTRAGQVDKTTMHPGDQVPMYGCSMAAVRVSAMWPTLSFPLPIDGTAAKPGQRLSWAVQYEIVVDRCYRNTEKNEMPDLADLDSLQRDAMDDFRAMMRAAQCAFTRGSVLLGQWLPRGPMGGMHGGSMTVTVAADLWCDCAVELPQFDEQHPPLAGDPRFPDVGRRRR